MDQPRVHSVLQTEWLINFSAVCGSHTGIHRLREMGLLLVESLEGAVASMCQHVLYGTVTLLRIPPTRRDQAEAW